MKILAITASPLENTENGSASKEALNVFLKNIKGEIQILNLNELEVSNKSLNSKNFSTFFSDGLSDKYIDLLKGIDKLIIAFPMINFGYPATLKNFLDHVLVANKTFKYKYDGKGESEGLLTNINKAQLIMTQGADEGWYQFSGFDKTLEGILNFVGVKEVNKLLIPGTKVGDNLKKNSKEQIEPHLDKIKDSANKF